eukprot:995130-Amorphochlora_amoeboformis.AAC.1
MDVESKSWKPTKFGGLSDETLRMYYSRLFPFKCMYRWLSYCNRADSTDQLSEKDFFMRREFSFTLTGDIYIRYLTFKNESEYKDAYLKRLPIKTDIGAIFNAPPKQHNAVSSFKPVEKELVFDIDMTDYDDVRTCCSDAKICPRCWKLMTVAIKVLNVALRDDFGFKHLLWVYSGRRGVHCWVCDSRARKLNDSGRAAVVSYLSAYTGGEKGQKVRLRNPIHPSLNRALKITEPEFKEYCEDQGLLDSEERWKVILDMVPEVRIKQDLHARWKDSSADASAKIDQLRKEIRKDISSSKFSKVRNTYEEIVFAHLYPRLDVNVSKGMNHLLKSPWSVHPKTGRVCVPIDPDNCEDFDPFSVPTIEDLLSDINSYKGKEKVQDWAKTRMAPYLEFFKTKFLQPLEASIRAKRREIATKSDMTF